MEVMRHAITIPEARALLRSRQDLFVGGMSDRVISRAVATGILHRVRRGWFVPRAEWENLWSEGRHLVHIVAVFRDARGSNAVFAGLSAAVLHGLPLYGLSPTRVELLVANPHHIHSSPDVLRREGVLPDSDTTLIEGMRVTSMERTVADVLRTTSLEAAVAIADASLRRVAVRRNTQNDDLADAWRERMTRQLHAVRGQRGVRQASWVLCFADGRAQLPGESVSRVQFHRLGVRNLGLQVRVPAPRGGSYWLDFDLKDFNAFGEFDGERKYTDEELRSDRSIQKVILDEKYREDWIRGITGRPLYRWGDKHIDSADTLGHRLRAFGLALPL